MTDNPPKSKNELTTMSLSQHLEELRKRVFYSVISLVIVFLGCLFFYREITEIIKYPYYKVIKILNESVSIVIQELKPGELFVVTMKLCLISALVIVAPFILYQIWLFVKSALYPKERKYVIFFTLLSILLFYAGIVFAFSFLPYALKFLVQWGDATIERKWGINYYISFILPFTLITGLIFQLPLVMLFISKIGLASYKKFIAIRKYSFLGILFFAAFFSPPDVFSQILLAIPMVGLYELGILMSYFFVKEKNKPIEED